MRAGALNLVVVVPVVVAVGVQRVFAQDAFDELRKRADTAVKAVAVHMERALVPAARCKGVGGCTDGGCVEHLCATGKVEEFELVCEVRGPMEQLELEDCGGSVGNKLNLDAPYYQTPPGGLVAGEGGDVVLGGLFRRARTLSCSARSAR